MKKQKTFLIKFAGAILHKVQRRGIRLYSSKYSRHDFTQHQHIVLLAVRQQRRYRVPALSRGGFA